VLDYLYSKDKSPLDFKWESLTAPPLLSLLSVYDIQSLNKVATSLRYAGKIKLKLSMIDDIMTQRGFKRFHCGTNRAVYMYYENSSIIVKVALDKVGLSDNPDEYKNQFLLKPFVTRCFEVSPCGTVGLFERITPIINKEEFKSVSEDVYNLLTKFVIGKYVLNDIGTLSWMNYGIRPGFGVCLLDFPYVYELDGNKLYCSAQLNDDTKSPLYCGGEIDYDYGFNNLVCNKCGKVYEPDKLQKFVKDKFIYSYKEGGNKHMKLNLTRKDGTKFTKVIGEVKSSKAINFNIETDEALMDPSRFFNSRRDNDSNEHGFKINKRSIDYNRSDNTSDVHNDDMPNPENQTENIEVSVDTKPETAEVNQEYHEEEKVVQEDIVQEEYTKPEKKPSYTFSQSYDYGEDSNSGRYGGKKSKKNKNKRNYNLDKF
jgi:hypothetical protein